MYYSHIGCPSLCVRIELWFAQLEEFQHSTRLRCIGNHASATGVSDLRVSADKSHAMLNSLRLSICQTGVA